MTFPSIYAITDSQLMRGDELLRRAQQAFAGGCRLIQYRDKSADRARRLSEAQALRQLCNDYKALLIINDDIDLALQVRADGVHLGQGDAPLHQARQILGDSAIIGITCHNRLELALAAERNGANYVAFGRFFNSATKPDAGACELAVLELARAQLHLPIVAIGGIERDNAEQVIRAGADSIALSRGLFGATDIRAETERLAQVFLSTSSDSR